MSTLLPGMIAWPLPFLAVCPVGLHPVRNNTECIQGLWPGRQGCGPSVIRLTSFCEYGFSVSALWCPLVTPTVSLGFLLPWTWGISSRLLQQSAATAPYLGWGVSPHPRPSWPSMWNSSSRPSCAHAATVPCTWGCSSWPPPLASDVG